MGTPNVINIRRCVITLVLLIFLSPSTSVFGQEEDCFKELEFKSLTISQFCLLMSDSLTVYKNKNIFELEHTSNDLYMIALIANTLEIYTKEIVSSGCLKEDLFYDYSDWLNNILMLYSTEVYGYQGLVFIKNKADCRCKLIFVKLED